MNKKLAATLVFGAAAVATAVGTAHAGAKYTYPLAINLPSRYAVAVLADVRNTGDTTRYFQCEVDASIYGSPSVTCSGQDSSSPPNYFQCVSSNASLIANAQSIGNDSWVLVAWDSNGNCTYLNVGKSSNTTPKTY